MSSTLSSGATQTRVPFWSRQFAVDRTKAQNTFDTLFGVILPVLVLIVDPVVFQGGLIGERPLLGKYQIFAYLISGIEMAILLVWLTLNRYVKGLSSVIGGALIGGAIFSVIVGIVILPYSLIGLILLVGAAGFIPFLTGFVYLRSGIRALRSQEKNATFQYRFLLATVATVIAVAVPAAVSFQYSTVVSANIQDLVYGDVQKATSAASRLQWLPLVPEVERNKIVRAYAVESNIERKNILGQYYKGLTGEDIELRLRIIND